MSQWKWNNIELEVDMEDADFQEKYEKAFKQMEADEGEVKKTGELSEITKSYCKLYWNLFDNIFGDGIAQKLFDGKKHSGLCEDCYASFLNHCQKQVIEVNKKRAARFAKYNVKK